MSNETENHEFKFGFGQATLELNSVLNTATHTHRAVKLIKSSPVRISII